MARQDALQGSLPLLVLKLLARRGPLHGYGIATQIENMSDETLRVEEGSLYPALHRLEEAGWIKARWTTTDTGRRARVYEITGEESPGGNVVGVEVTASNCIQCGAISAKGGRLTPPEGGDGPEYTLM